MKLLVTTFKNGVILVCFQNLTNFKISKYMEIMSDGFQKN